MPFSDICKSVTFFFALPFVETFTHFGLNPNIYFCVNIWCECSARNLYKRPNRRKHRSDVFTFSTWQCFFSLTLIRQNKHIFFSSRWQHRVGLFQSVMFRLTRNLIWIYDLNRLFNLVVSLKCYPAAYPVKTLHTLKTGFCLILYSGLKSGNRGS